MTDENVATRTRIEIGDGVLSPTDAELLLLFARNQDEKAFRKLVEKHAPLVMGVCRQILRCDADVDDAFQATFIVLSRRADSIKTADSLASWLYKVAYRTAWHTAKRRVKRKETSLDNEVVTEDDVALQKIHEQECHKILHEELNRLPDRYQAPIILFHLQDRSREETANELELTDATVKARLARGRKMLRLRLARRGIGVSAAMGVAAAFCQTAQASTRTAELIERCCSAATDSNPTTDFSEGSNLLANQEIQRMIVSSASRPMITYGSIAATLVLMLFGWRGISPARATDTGDRSGIVEVHSSHVTAATDDLVVAFAPSDSKELPAEPNEPDADSRTIRPGDIVAIWVGNGLPDSPIRGRFQVESTGKVALGPYFGRVKVDGLDIEGVEKTIEAHLGKFLKEPRVIATHDYLPGEAQETARQHIASANDALVPGEVLRIRIGESYNRPSYDEFVEIEADGMLPIGFLFTRLNTKQKNLTQLEQDIQKKLVENGVFRQDRVRVLITRRSETSRERSEAIRTTFELNDMKHQMNEIYRHVR